MLLLYLSLIEDDDNKTLFSKIYYENNKLMYNVAFSYLHDHHYSEDAIQNAFLGIAKNMNVVKRLNKEKLQIYICKCVKNACINLSKDINRSYKCFSQLERCERSADISNDITDNVISAELIEDIASFVHNMDDAYRDIVSLHLLNGLTFREISSSLNMPVSTVKYRFKIGLELVHDKFKELDYDKS